ncbi:hypothetical protein AAE478_005961 [Parahypoxylon ruwenzoriense]
MPPKPYIRWGSDLYLDIARATWEAARLSSEQVDRIMDKLREKGHTFTREALRQHFQKLKRKENDALASEISLGIPISQTPGENGTILDPIHPSLAPISPASISPTTGASPIVPSYVQAPSPSVYGPASVNPSTTASPAPLPPATTSPGIGAKRKSPSDPSIEGSYNRYITTPYQQVKRVKHHQLNRPNQPNQRRSTQPHFTQLQFPQHQFPQSQFPQPQFPYPQSHQGHFPQLQPNHPQQMETQFPMLDPSLQALMSAPNNQEGNLGYGVCYGGQRGSQLAVQQTVPMYTPPTLDSSSIDPILLQGDQEFWDNMWNQMLAQGTDPLPAMDYESLDMSYGGPGAASSR